MFITYGSASAFVNGNAPRLMAHRALVSPWRETQMAVRRGNCEGETDGSQSPLPKL